MGYFSGAFSRVADPPFTNSYFMDQSFDRRLAWLGNGGGTGRERHHAAAAARAERKYLCQRNVAAHRGDRPGDWRRVPFRSSMGHSFPIRPLADDGVYRIDACRWKVVMRLRSESNGSSKTRFAFSSITALSYPDSRATR